MLVLSVNSQELFEAAAAEFIADIAAAQPLKGCWPILHSFTRCHDSDCSVSTGVL